VQCICKLFNRIISIAAEVGHNTRSTPLRGHGYDNAAMARLPHSRVILGHFSWYRVLPLGDRWTTKDRSRIHLGQSQTRHFADGPVAICIISISYYDAWYHGGNVLVWRTVSRLGSCLVHNIYSTCRATVRAMDLSAETGQHQ
jgi:hypothetical protein